MDGLFRVYTDLQYIPGGLMSVGGARESWDGE